MRRAPSTTLLAPILALWSILLGACCSPGVCKPTAEPVTSPPAPTSEVETDLGTIDVPAGWGLRVADQGGAGVFWLGPPSGGLVVIVMAYEVGESDPLSVRNYLHRSDDPEPESMTESRSASGPTYCGTLIGETRLSAMCMSVRSAGDGSVAYIARVLMPREKQPLFERIGGEATLRAICESARDFTTAPA